MSKPSIAKEFFDQLVSRADAFVHMLSWIKASPPVVETEWLDFKAWRNLSDDDVKKIWSKALAGFANTQGGVLVWGLDCRKEGEPPVDQVCGESLVKNIESFASRLMELHHQATEPPVLGLEMRPILDPSNSSQGFLVCLVPESSFRPHRAEYAGKQYYIRAGDDFIIPSPSLLRSLFLPGSASGLSVVVAAGHVTSLGETWLQYFVYLKNDGLVSVKGVSVVLGPGDHTGDIKTPSGFQKRETAMFLPSFESPRAIYPSETVLVFTHREGNKKRATEMEWGLESSYEREYEFYVFAHNQPALKASVRFERHDAINLKTKRCHIEELRTSIDLPWLTPQSEG